MARGCFPALWTASWPGLATILGVILPIALVCIATYILVRQPWSQGKEDPLGSVPD